jgi:pimeloyl-ACP methyl ester carboxylesterase
VEFYQPANRGLWADLQVKLPGLESSLASIRVPFGVVVGELSPMPPSAGTQSADRIPGAWSYVEPGAGHFVWYEAPGCLLAAMDRLVAAT